MHWIQKARNIGSILKHKSQNTCALFKTWMDKISLKAS